MSSGWLCSIPRTVPQGSGLWQAIWLAWEPIRKGLQKIEPGTHGEKMRQQLFFNPQNINVYGCPLGVDRKSKYRNWTRKGIFVVEDVWIQEDYSFMTEREIYIKTPSHHIAELYEEVTSACNNAFNLELQCPHKVGDWLASEADNEEAEFYQLARWWKANGLLGHTAENRGRTD